LTDLNPQVRIAIVIPCYRTKNHILKVLAAIAPQYDAIYVVDDKCPDQTGQFVLEKNTDRRVRVLFHEANQGVGGAVVTGYKQAIADGATVMVKIDGDGQMDPRLIDQFLARILDGSADYTKGNRFFDLENIGSMPKIRIFGNAALSFITKLSSGYWNIFDPTNGYTAIHARVAERLPLDKLSKRYFFESDMLFRLNTLRAGVIDVPMDARYGDEVSSLRIRLILMEFVWKHCSNFFKRVFYNYFLRDFSLASLELVIGLLLFMFGVVFGSLKWWESLSNGLEASAGTVMLAALPLLAGLQLLLAFIGHDIRSVPLRALHPMLSRKDSFRSEAGEIDASD
jgi:dolichol-phosphate mannosyltransferase